jgi:hypothetical protein
MESTRSTARSLSLWMTDEQDVYTKEWTVLTPLHARSKFHVPPTLTFQNIAGRERLESGEAIWKTVLGLTFLNTA